MYPKVGRRNKPIIIINIPSHEIGSGLFDPEREESAFVSGG